MQTQDIKETANQAMNQLTQNPQVEEGSLTRAVEEQTAKVPSLGYFNMALGSMVLSATTALVFRKRDLGNFFGLWAPCFLLIGIYNKLVKMEKHMAEVNPS